MAETSSLLNCRTGNRTTSSNLVLSATGLQKCSPFCVEAETAISPAAHAAAPRGTVGRTPQTPCPSALRTSNSLPPVCPLIACGVTRRARPPGRANLVRTRSDSHRRSAPHNRQDETGAPPSKPLLGHVIWFHSLIWAHETRLPSPQHLLRGVDWLHLGGIPSFD